MFQDPILFITYTVILSGLIFYTGFFKLFEDSVISKKQFGVLFLGKALAVPVFLFVYTKMYGGITEFDTGKFYNDVKVICDYGKTDLNFLFRLLIGLQDDRNGSSDYVHVLQNTLNWDNGTVKDYLFNDNRVVIRTHVLLNFIAFNSYPVHALLNCFLSFIGIFFFYKTFKEWFEGKELWLLLILCFFPAFWFYTGALLKEGITFFILGCILYQIKKIIDGDRGVVRIIWFLFLFFISIILKPYVLVFAALCFSLFFIVYRSRKIKRKLIFFFSVFTLIIFSVNCLSVLLKHRSLLDAALKQQHRFVGVSKGGFFLADSINFIRLTNDTNQVKKVSGKKDYFTIKKNVSYMYWKTVDQRDTLYCLQNQDTITSYQFMYVIQPGKSNIELPHSNPIYILSACLYYTLFYPTFYSARNALQLLASFENLFILAALLIILIGLIKSKKDRFMPLVFVFFAFSLCALIGLTSPNSGAIFRYRSPAMIFLLLAALYYVKDVWLVFGFREDVEDMQI